VVLVGQADDFYEVLGVARDAGASEIRRAYRRLARQHHPDRNPEPDGPERFRTLAEAYAVLNDPARRARYDHTIRRSARRDVPGAESALLTRRGVLELSRREARIAASTPLALSTADGIAIVLPAGVGDGDRVIFAVGDVGAVLTIRVNGARKT
jgi:curved DNA-binding protein CbpA